MTKSDLCAKAEASGLLKPGVSMYPPAAASARPGQSKHTLSHAMTPVCLVIASPLPPLPHNYICLIITGACMQVLDTVQDFLFYGRQKVVCAYEGAHTSMLSMQSNTQGTCGESICPGLHGCLPSYLRTGVHVCL